MVIEEGECPSFDKFVAFARENRAICNDDVLHEDAGDYRFYARFFGGEQLHYLEGKVFGLLRRCLDNQRMQDVIDILNRE